MMSYIWWSLPLTLAVFFAARRLAAHFKMPLLNPLLVAMVVIIPFLLLTGIPYDHYFKGSEVLNDLLQPAVVALAYPLYEQLHQIRARWKSIISICFVGSMVAMITGTSVALLMGATPEIAASVLPKSVTTPIAMAVGGSIGGIPAISAVCVIFVGILGAVFGHTLLNAMRIRTKAARGLAMGTASHALGTGALRRVGLPGRRVQLSGVGDLRHYYLAGSALFVSTYSGGNALTTGQKTGLKFAMRSAFFI
ncbi:LrgA-associated membrane protein LrgB [Salmonella enterica subsp. arizonae]|uniref:LrgA-associated membrane protein LrgB n=1 Tax=Salmonella enterica subsp. arizonae TaxID=59203 RepID=A0A379SM63_SALER|nr:LrgA-associated membrane protein LrgB [Salmonella enterica subsp. arizonae]